MEDIYTSELRRRENWRTLTTMEDKFEHFARDSNFRQGWRTARDVLGPNAPALLQRIAVLTLKPDGIFGRKAEDCVRWLVDNDFLPVHAERVHFDRLVTREMWRYWWSAATLDRIAISERVNSSGPALQIFLVDRAPHLVVPASTRLTTLKGSGDPAQRDSCQLRSVLGAPNRTLALLHTPDEPIDILREAAVQFDNRTLAEILALLRDFAANPQGDGVDRHVARLNRDVPRRTLSVAEATDEVLRDLAVRQRGGDMAASNARSTLLAAMAGGSLDWYAWSRDLAACGLDVDPWAVTVAASQYIRNDIPGASTAINGTGYEDWLAGNGVMLATRPLAVAS